MKIINGVKIADKILKKAGKKIKEKKLKLKMSAVLVGGNSISLSYISRKKKSCQQCGIDFSLYQFPKSVSQKKLCQEIIKISKKSSGVIVQLPLPLGFETQEILNAVPEKKDIDFLSEINSGKFYSGNFSVLPPVVGAVNYVFKENEISIKNKNIVLIGYGNLVGKPLSVWLASQGATLSITNKLTQNTSFFTCNADILISGVGKPDLIKGNMVKKAVIAIDIGSGFKDGKIVGDFDRSVFKKASIITPVPGGVGPITTACLIENLVKMNS